MCTLGGQPQVATLTLDLLLARGEEITQVVVVFMASNPRYQQAYQRLLAEFSGDRYAGRPMRLRGIPIRLLDSPIAEARSPTEVDAVWQTFAALLADLKANAQQVHLSLSGGRRILALLASSVAMLHFTTSDHAWHIYTPPEVTELMQDGRLLHAPPGADVRLIEVPLTPWATYFPGLRDVLGTSPIQARSARLGWLDETDRARCQQVWEALSARQRDTLRALCAYETREQAAAALNLSVDTLDSHKTEIFRHCRLAWERDKRPDLAFLRRYFKPFLAEQEGNA